MNACTRKKYTSEWQANKVRDVINTKPKAEKRVYTMHCTQCRAYHVVRGQ